MAVVYFALNVIIMQIHINLPTDKNFQQCNHIIQLLSVVLVVVGVSLLLQYVVVCVCFCRELSRALA